VQLQGYVDDLGVVVGEAGVTGRVDGYFQRHVRPSSSAGPLLLTFCI